MTRGLGNDLIEISRIRASMERHGLHFINRIFTEKEQDYCYRFKDPAPHFAGRFAAKEAIAKALGTGFGAHLAWKEVEILNDEQGKPQVHLSDAARKTFDHPQIHVAITHSTDYAMAVAIWN